MLAPAQDRPVTVALIGAGQRGGIYADYISLNPSTCRLVALAEPRPTRRSTLAKRHSIPTDLVFKDWKELASRGKVADAVIIAIMDRGHAEAVKVFAEQGYDILCEKPIATSIEECVGIVEAVKKHGVIFGCGHVLRYSPYNTSIRQTISTGVLGKIINIQHLEPVGRQHFAHSYVRGNWRNESTASFSLMAKSCHDIDILNFYRSDQIEPRSLSSFGNLNHFKPSEKPKEAGDATHCVGCAYEPECPYSAKKIYLEPVYDGPKRDSGDDIWATHILDEPPDIENVAAAIQPDGIAGGRWGKCVYSGDNDVVDQQVVNIQYKDGTTASFTMIAFTKQVCNRVTRIHGSHGEIVGDMSTYTVTDFRTGESTHHSPANEGGGHGGGDMGLMRSFIRACSEQDQTALGVEPEDILRSHLMVFAAEESRLKDQNVLYDDFQKRCLNGSSA